MTKVISNIAAGATQPAIVFGAIFIIVQWRGMAAEYSAYLSPPTLLHAFLGLTVFMALAFYGLQTL